MIDQRIVKLRVALPKMSTHSGRFSVSTIAIFMILLLVACDPGTIITVENGMSIPIKTDHRSVALDYSGPLVPRDLSRERSIKPGETQRFTTLIHPKREYGAREKYIEYALSETGELVYQRTFTWDELNAMGWKIVVEPQK